MSDSSWPHGLQHTRLPCPSLTPGVCSNSCPLSRWCHPTISFSVIPFSLYLQSFPASGSFPMCQLFVTVGQSIGASASALVPPMNIQDWFLLELTGLFSLQSERLSRVGEGAIVFLKEIPNHDQDDKGCGWCQQTWTCGGQWCLAYVRMGGLDVFSCYSRAPFELSLAGSVILSPGFWKNIWVVRVLLFVTL